jgi:hypothetical protein
MAVPSEAWPSRLTGPATLKLAGILRLRYASAKDGGVDANLTRTEVALILKGAYQSRLLAKAWPEPDFR